MKPKPPMSCGMVNGVMVHRFDQGSRVCKCGERIVSEPELKPRWKEFGRRAKVKIDVSDIED